MIQSEYPDFETKAFRDTIKAAALIILVAGLTICGILIALKASDQQPQKPITPYEKVINPKSTPDHFLDGKTN